MIKKEVEFSNAYLSVDTIISSVLSIGFFLPLNIKSSLPYPFIMLITVLSIIFSLFFAALAIIMSSTDNDFIKYMEERVNKGFTRFMNTFKVVLVALFLSLIYSIVLYTTTDFYIKNNNDTAVQNKYLFIVFQFCFHTV
ncbi:MAG: hypothetical protein IPI66_12240 [Chitinophagaceae bacterium]|nr:hypothetical protein [Chitinophagaceae bacterium]